MIVGRKYTGKSTLAAKIAHACIKPYRRVLIINVNGSPAYSKFPAIDYDRLQRWRSGGGYQFYDRDHDRLFDFLIDRYDPTARPPRLFSGLIVFEDCTKYIDANPPKKIKSFLVDHRMMDADMIFTFHALTMVPQFFWKMTSRIILLKTQDIMTPSRAREMESRIPNWAAVQQAHAEVMADPDPFAHRVVDTLI